LEKSRRFTTGTEALGQSEAREQNIRKFLRHDFKKNFSSFTSKFNFYFFKSSTNFKMWKM